MLRYATWLAGLVLAGASPASALPSCHGEDVRVEFTAAGGERGYVIELRCATAPRFVRWDLRQHGGSGVEVVERDEGPVRPAVWAATFRVIEASLGRLSNWACPEETGDHDLYYVVGYLHDDEFKHACRTARLPKRFAALFRAIEEAAR